MVHFARFGRVKIRFVRFQVAFRCLIRIRFEVRHHAGVGAGCHFGFGHAETRLRDFGGARFQVAFGLAGCRAVEFQNQRAVGCRPTAGCFRRRRGRLLPGQVAAR